MSKEKNDEVQPETNLCRLVRFETKKIDEGVQYQIKDWIARLNAFLKFNERDILENAGKVTAEIAKSFAATEFEKYTAIRDKPYESDFDREIKKLLASEKAK